MNMPDKKTIPGAVDIEVLREAANEIIRLMDDFTLGACLFPRANYRAMFPRIRDGRLFVRVGCMIDEIVGEE